MVVIYNELYVQPQDVRCEIVLRRYKDYDFFVCFGCGLLITAFLEFILRIPGILIFFAFIVSLFGTILFGLITLVSADIGKTYRNIDKILITKTGIALKNYQGYIDYVMPFANVTGIRYGYREHVVSAAPDPDARMPVFVQFELAGGKKFTIPMDYIVAADEKKIFTYLPVTQ